MDELRCKAWRTWCVVAVAVGEADPADAANHVVGLVGDETAAVLVPFGETFWAPAMPPQPRLVQAQRLEGPGKTGPIRSTTSADQQLGRRHHQAGCIRVLNAARPEPLSGLLQRLADVASSGSRGMP
jgi:hypothetical protein